MLKSLEVSNYALIDELHVEFDSDFTILTGETGAGKSILLGALGLILGERADHNALLDKERKCIIEGTFKIVHHTLLQLLQSLELDEGDGQCIIRRVIHPGGRSRAFVNDSPVKLGDLEMIGEQLIDIHKQDDISLLMDQTFRLALIDGQANNEKQLRTYRAQFDHWRKATQEYETLKERVVRSEEERDFLQFQWSELNELKLEREELSTIEEDHSLLAHGVELAEGMEKTLQALEREPGNLLDRIREIRDDVQRMGDHLSSAVKWEERFESVSIELQDLSAEIDQAFSKIEIDPARLSELEERLAAIHHLVRKHHLDNAVDLIDKREDLHQKLNEIVIDGERLQELEGRKDTMEYELRELAKRLHEERKSHSSTLSDAIVDRLRQMGMPSAEMEIRLNESEKLHRDGFDQVAFLFSANQGMEGQEIKKIASGGERSRLMLAIKEVGSHYLSLPTMIFDEIDTGVSGAIARKMGELLSEMGQRMQILAITHIPQVAALGKRHYHISKKEDGSRTSTLINELKEDERIVVIAEMIGGKKDDQPSLDNARALLGRN
jgi:DNA repair protein RecN (Recombination protein N)